MLKKYQTFIFEDYEFVPAEQKVVLRYSYDSELFFCETFELGFDIIENYDEAALDRALFGLFITAGISYYKACLAPTIEIKKGCLDKEQKAFFEKLYYQGLGEFFYRNGVDFRGLVDFPESEIRITNHESRIKMEGLSGSIVAIGGGKDSLVTAEVLKGAGEDFETWTVGDYPFFDEMLGKICKKHLSIKRKIAPELLELNKEGALNGHVPISAILAFLSIVTAILRGKKQLIFSNEGSANEENTIMHGMKINHQYSKSLEFEKDFQNYVRKYISPDLEYFSFLRPLSEFQITQLFVEKCFEKYKDDFSSCNRNFRLSGKNESWQWCGACPKCTFVFLMLSAFLKKNELLALFHGKNLFEDPTLEHTFQELLGNSGHKPFECVGSYTDCNRALKKALESNNYPELSTFQINEIYIKEDEAYEHAMPEEFYNMVKRYV